jgi:hypothetical protein
MYYQQLHVNIFIIATTKIQLKNQLDRAFQPTPFCLAQPLIINVLPTCQTNFNLGPLEPIFQTPVYSGHKKRSV